MTDVAQLTITGEAEEVVEVVRLFDVGEPVAAPMASCPCCGARVARHGIRCGRCARSGFEPGTLFAES